MSDEFLVNLMNQDEPYIKGMNTVHRGGAVKTRTGLGTVLTLPVGTPESIKFLVGKNGEPVVQTTIDGVTHRYPSEVKN